ncbi:MAG: helix-turn-helix domain-containing protein [Saprospiraceae bacterium]
MQLLFNFILSVGITLTAVILLVNFKKPHAKRSAYLNLIFIVLLFVCIHNYSEENNISFLTQLTYIIADAVGFILGPTIYWYVKSIYRDLPEKRKIYWLHYSPLIIYVLLISGPIFLGQLLVTLPNNLADYLQFLEDYQILLQIQALYWAFYAILALNELKKYKLRVQQNYSNLQHRYAVWLRHILQAILFFMAAHLAIELVIWQYELPYFSNGILTSLFLVLMIAYIGYHGIEQPEVQLNQLTTKSNVPKQHHLYNTDQATINNLKKSLLIVLEQEKPYLEEQLSLAQLSQKLGISDKKLSALLNHYIGESFYDLINRYRVEHAKGLILDPNYEHLTLLAIGMEAGFSSKSSFNRIFKKVAGLSPSQFKKNKK